MTYSKYTEYSPFQPYVDAEMKRVMEKMYRDAYRQETTATKVEVLPATQKQIDDGNQYMWQTSTPGELYILMKHLARHEAHPAFTRRGWEPPPLQCSNCVHLKGDDYAQLSIKCAQGCNMRLRYNDKCAKKEATDA
jgi:hypothetical protein